LNTPITSRDNARIGKSDRHLMVIKTNKYYENALLMGIPAPKERPNNQSRI